MLVNVRGVRTGFSIVEPGVYDAIVSDARETTSSNGNEMIALTLVCHDPKTGETAGRVMDFLTKSENALWKIRLFLEAIGVDEDALDSEDGIEFRATDLIGRNLVVVIKKDVSKKTGKPMAQVADMLPAGVYSRDELVKVSDESA